jgi:predicted  nucleic acid-binding Zn-ribbon protein
MADEPDNLVLDLLRNMRAEQAGFRGEALAELRDIKHRMTAVEIALAQLLGLDAAKSDRIDRLEGRIDRIERRLDLKETP